MCIIVCIIGGLIVLGCYFTFYWYKVSVENEKLWQVQA